MDHFPNLILKLIMRKRYETELILFEVIYMYTFIKIEMH